MKKTAIPFLTALVVLVACNSRDDDSSKADPNATKPYSKRKVVAVVTKPDSSKVLSAVLEIISDKIKYDSIAGKKVIVTDTIYGEWAPMAFKTQAGKDTVVYDWFLKSRDSINTKVENRDLDSLLKN
jgi:hypothetical protein